MHRANEESRVEKRLNYSSVMWKKICLYTCPTIIGDSKSAKSDINADTKEFRNDLQSCHRTAVHAKQISKLANSNANATIFIHLNAYALQQRARQSSKTILMTQPHPQYIWNSAPWQLPANTQPEPDDDVYDAYDTCKDSPFVDTLVEGGVVLVIAALINVALWGIVRFGSSDHAALFGQVA